MRTRQNQIAVLQTKAKTHPLMAIAPGVLIDHIAVETMPKTFDRMKISEDLVFQIFFQRLWIIIRVKVT
jgi:hypothetical protein